MNLNSEELPLKTASKNNPLSERVEEVSRLLKKNIRGDVRTDLTTRILYSTDASIYQIEPLGVVFPKDEEDLQATVETCAKTGSPVLARGSGSSLAGQAIGAAWIVDCSRYLDHILRIDPEEQIAVVQPGVILNALNRQAAQYGLMFGPDPASAERASLGGSIANNATGAHSIRYGMAADHLLGVNVVLADGSLANFKDISLDQAGMIAADRQGLEADIYRGVLHIREKWASEIKARWPVTWRRASGYNLNYLLPWSPTEPPTWREEGLAGSFYPPVHPGSLNLASLMAGSEGTLAVIRDATIRLVQKPERTLLLVLAYATIVEACDQVESILGYGPSAVELIPQNLIRLAQSASAYASQVSVLSPLYLNGAVPPNLLLVEFSGDQKSFQSGLLYEKAKRLAAGKLHLIADTVEGQRQIWGIRKVGLGLFLSRPGDAKPWSFIEDLAVPVNRLSEFVREMYRLMDDFGVEGENYGHASAGCLHIRPVINLKTAAGVQTLRQLASEAVDLTLRLGGAVSGEHGDGLARSEWNERMFGGEIVEAFRHLKNAFDPVGILNPGKIISPNSDQSGPKMDESLRLGSGSISGAWQPVMDFSRQESLAGAIEMCNGAGVCRKSDGLMCPSFQAARDEMYSTRGRANLLRAMIYQRFPTEKFAEKVVFDALDMCLACKGCKAECPSAVDMAKLKYEFIDQYYSRHPRKVRDYLFGYIDRVARLTQPFWIIANPIMASRFFTIFLDRCIGVSEKRALPSFARSRLRSEWKRASVKTGKKKGNSEKVLFLSDAFNEYFYPEVGLAALRALEQAGCEVELIPIIGAGRTLVSKGMLKSARAHAKRLVDVISRLDPKDEAAIVGVEPSEVLTLCDEYLDLLAQDERVRSIAHRSLTIEEYLIRPKNDQIKIMRIANIASNESFNPINLKYQNQTNVILHGHCYQKARPPHTDNHPVGVEATVKMLTEAGYRVQVMDTGCCGMAGAFGYENEHLEMSLKVGELSLFPVIRKADPDSLVVASGVSCRSQIEDGTGRRAYHPVELLFMNRD